MFKLLSLIFLSLITLPLTLLGTEAQLGLSLISTKQRGVVDVFRLNNTQKAESFLSRLNIQIPSIKNYWTLALSLDAAKKDYSNFLLRTESGEEIPLSNSFDSIEYTANLSISYQKANNAISGLIAHSLNKSPFSFSAGSLSYNRIFLNKKRVLGTRFLFSQKEQPGSTYIDSKTLETKERATELNSFRYELSWNEAFNQKWRMNTIAFYGTRREDRPDHYGLELRNGLGISDILTLRLHTGFLNERQTGLKDDRGYFSILWTETSVYWEFKYDYSLEASYGLTLERENFADNRGKTTVGTDSYGLKFDYNGLSSILSASYIYRATNTNYNSHIIQGAIKWSI